MMKKTEYKRVHTKKVVKVRQTPSAAMVCLCRDSGLTKFGVVPGGGGKPPTIAGSELPKSLMASPISELSTEEHAQQPPPIQSANDLCVRACR